jgi:hypothetical protein
MGSSIRVLNSDKSEFDFSKIKISTQYNIVLHCVYNPDDHFDTEFAFLNDSSLDSNTVVILWHAVEQGVWDYKWMSKLDAIVEHAPYRLIYLTGAAGSIPIPHKFNIQFFPVFDVRSVDIHEGAHYLRPPPVTAKRDNKFMFINAKDVMHRRYVLVHLLKNNLINQGTVSYQCTQGIEIFHDAELDQCADYLPIKIDNNNVASRLSRSVFMNAYLGVVGETQFSNAVGFNLTFLTEKTFNAIANNQILAIVGHAGSLHLLKQLGYKTFGSIIDESYDDIVDDRLRLDAVTKEIVRFVNRPIEQIHNDYVSVAEELKYNQDLLFSQSLEQKLQQLINQL